MATGTPGTRFLLVRDAILYCMDQRGQLNDSLRAATKGGKHGSWKMVEKCPITQPLELEAMELAHYYFTKCSICCLRMLVAFNEMATGTEWGSEKTETEGRKEKRRKKRDWSLYVNACTNVCPTE